MKRKLLSALLLASLMLGCLSGVLSVAAAAAVRQDVSSYLVEESDIPLRLYYDEEASHGVSQGYDDVDTYFGSGAPLIEAHPNDDWERWSIPIGNGYFGANLFGRTETERIQLTEKTLANPYRIVSGTAVTDGLNNFSETYIDFGHVSSEVTDYSRELDLKTAISTVNYKYNGVEYSREYFTSYPDKALVIKLDASQAGELDFVLRPTVPYEQEYMTDPGDRGGKTGTVTSSVENGVGTVVLSGKLEYFDIDFAGIYKVYTDGTVSATTCVNKDGDTDGTITVTDASSAYIVVTIGTDYELTSETFLNSTTSKPTFTTTLDYAMNKVEGYMDAASAYSYDELKARHLADYTEIFGRVTLDIDCKESDFALTTDELLTQYKNGSGSSYLETLYFQYGRYLLIASSRSGALPANLQGAWNRYNHSPWSSGYWHNINVQMNYWPAFSTNIAETFEAYVEYNNAYMAKAEQGASSIVNQYNKDAYGLDGGNGWSIATGGYVFDVYGADSIGNLGFTTQLFWEYYAYSGDKELLREKVYPILVSAARFITKMVKEDADGNYLAIRSDSPEQYVDGVWYYTSEGTGYAQSFAYQNNYNLLLAAKELGIDANDASGEDYAILNTVLEQIDKYDPVRVGFSGQVKEFFEEDYYGDLGEYTHRHISQLVGLYPGNVINGTTPAWIDAAKYTLTERGDKATGWGVAHRLNLWARVQDGERAYDLLEQLLKVNTATNLWDLHPPFQIDGNLGGTSGISEMLLQSHAGYVEPLAAIPATWANGSYTGLVARGNFEVSAAWADGLATSFNILSKNGGEISVKYSGIGNATVTDSSGKAVEYSVSGNDIITFNTEAGKTYIIWGFTAKNIPDSVEGLTIDTDVLSPSVLTWSASDDAVAYNVYVAKRDASDYSLLTTTLDTTYTYNPPAGENARLTFAVTAVGADGSESKRALAYRVPDDLSAPVLDVSASIVNDELQVVIKSNDYSEKFRLYGKAKANDNWTLVSESKYPVIIDETYVKTNIYGVSVVNRFGEESEITKIGVYNTSSGTIDFNSANILEGAVFVPTAEGDTYKHTSAAHGDYGKLTDGDFNITTGRFSTKATSSDVLEGVITLPAKFLLGELKIYDFNGYSKTALYMGQHLKVDVYCNGSWTTVKEYSSNDDILALRKSDANGNYIGIDLSTYKAQLIRIRLDTPILDNEQRSLSINEIQCTGVAIGEGMIGHTNVFDGYEFAATDPSMDSEWKAYKYITDGLVGWSDPGRFATKSGKPADATLDFDGKVYILSELTIEYTSADLCGLDISIFVYRNNAWTKVVDKVYDTGVAKITFNLNDVEAEKIRFAVSGQRSTANYIGISEMSCTGYEVIGLKSPSENVLLGTTKEQLTLTGATVHASVPNLDFAFDGNLSTRYAVYDASPYSYSLEIALNGTYQLFDMSFYPFFNAGETVSRSDNTKIEVFDNGVWTTVVTGFDIKPIACNTVSLGGALASKIKITFENTKGTQNATLNEIKCSGIAADNTSEKEDVNSNVLAGRTEDQLVLGNGSIHPGAGPLTSAFDGDKTTKTSRFAILGAPNYFTLDIALDNPAPLYTLAIYPYFDTNETTSRSDNTKIEVYVDGIWITVVTGLELAPSKEPTTASLYGVIAEKIRITFANKETTTNATIYEITCTSGVVDAVDRKPLLEAYIALEATEIDPGVSETKEASLASAKEYLMDTEADGEAVESYIEAINTLIDELKSYVHECTGGEATCEKKAVCSVCGKEYGSLAEHTIVALPSKAPTCTETGLTAGEGCSVCGLITVEQEELPMTDHAVVTILGKAPTCTEPGLSDGEKCSVCNVIILAQAIVDALGHTEIIDTDVAPTCTETGLTEGKHCSVCDEVIVAQIKVPASGHSDLDPQDYVCDVCGIELCAEHKEEILEALAPTCTETGLTEGKKCGICGHILVPQNIVEALGHTEVIDEAVAPTCTENGLTEGKHCSVCGEILVAQTVVEALGHTEIIDEAVAPTCTETGLTEGKHCSVCGEILVAQTVVDVLGHTEIIDEDVAPTCTETGLSEGKHCSVCGEILVTQTVVDALGHTEVIDEAVAPTCTENGLTEGKHCSVCGEILVAQTVVDALGHTEVIDKAVAPTCTENGFTAGTRCSVCDEILISQVIINALGHIEAINEAVAPTCTENGLTEGKHCSVCGEILVAQTVVDALGHTEVIDEAVAPTCTETGLTEGKHCSVCNEVITAQTVVDATGHKWTDATTEDPKTCTVCGATDGDKLPEPTPDPEPDPEPAPEPPAEEMNLFQRIWQAILNFFRKLFGLDTDD